MSQRYEWLEDGAELVSTRQGMDDMADDGLQDYLDGDSYLVLGNPYATAAVIQGDKDSIIKRLESYIDRVRNSPGNQADDHVFVDDGTDMHLCAWGRIPYALVYRYGMQYDGQRIEQVTDCCNGHVILRLQDGRTVDVEPDGDDMICGDAADSQNHRYDPDVITTPLSEILDAPEDPEVKVTVTKSSGPDGAAVVFIDTNFEPDASDGGPGLRVRVNDTAILNASGRDAFGSVAATGGVDLQPIEDGEKQYVDRTLTVRLSEITSAA